MSAKLNDTAQAPWLWSFREQAIRLYVDGFNLRRIARILGVNHLSVANWVHAHTERLTLAPLAEHVETSELDELFTFVGCKKWPLSHDKGGSRHPLDHRMGSGPGAK